MDKRNDMSTSTGFLIVLFSEGSGLHYIDGIGYPISKGQLHFVFPGQEHHLEVSYETKAHKLVISTMLFEEFSCIEELYYIKHTYSPVFNLNEEVFESIRHEMLRIEGDLELMKNDEIFKKILLRRIDIISSVIKYEVVQYFENIQNSDVNQTIKKLWVLVNQHCNIQKNVSWYAGKLCITPNYLNILCKRILNTTISDIINQKIMYEAKQQLRFSKKNIKEIAFDLGFACPSSFTAFFKKNAGLTPVAYRE
ncbi:AraC family transcriptional regulator [Chryseobacterium sp. G0162]|nr:AraC family transcriptional regulator [Chryseobacterium sp. G0162]